MRIHRNETGRLVVTLARPRVGKRARGGRFVAGLAVVLAAAVPAAGCAFDPSSVPVPGSEVSGPTYDIHIQFANVLNLPARAKIMANGAQVGTVSGVSVVDSAKAGGRGYVVVDARISKSVRLPAATRAELRQNTVLGDIHLALLTPPNGFDQLLPVGGTIPLAQTKPPVQLEDTMAALATFTQGGAVQQVQDTIEQLNRVLPADPARTAQIGKTLADDAVDLGNHLDELDSLLDGIDNNANVLHGIRPVLADLLTQESVDQMNGIAPSIVGVTKIFNVLGPIGSSLTWLGPLLNGADGSVQAFLPLLASARPLDLSQPSNLQALISLVRDKIIPFAEHGPKVNITGVKTDAPVPIQEQTDRIVQTLRMIGVVR
ncbi:virulence factor Mce-like protein [Nocardia tenerifensis]|uniref:Virulence factor Mce-like protein n=1 Tax=Nocardia tenerifensis TaxID=228006 RepID=A0A318K1G3_9NOCA|nr:MlaD family protein [Nocardia tenerifensis]PXX61515.1 virulence factor Mce-like protein [Nocardia tenerifensis]